MVNLIHIRVNACAPSCCPNLKCTVVKLLKSIDVRSYINLKAVLVKDLCCDLKGLVCGVVGGVTCDGEGVLENVVTLLIDAVCVLSVACIVYELLTVVAALVECIVLSKLVSLVGICPGCLGHRTGNGICIAEVVVNGILSIDCVHDSASYINILNLLSVDTDVTVTVGLDRNACEAVVTLISEGVDVLLLTCGLNKMNVAAEERIKHKISRNYLISNIFNLYIKEEVFIALKVYYVACLECTFSNV